MCIPGWMLLRLEQRVKVPEGTLNKVIGGHFSEAEEKKEVHGFAKEKSRYTITNKGTKF